MRTPMSPLEARMHAAYDAATDVRVLRRIAHDWINAGYGQPYSAEVKAVLGRLGFVEEQGRYRLRERVLAESFETRRQELGERRDWDGLEALEGEDLPD